MAEERKLCPCGRAPATHRVHYGIPSLRGVAFRTEYPRCTACCDRMAWAVLSSSAIKRVEVTPV